jgi:hypothetical protein
MTSPFDMDDESELERIRGQDKKPKMGILNQKKVSKWEMDELFADEDDYYEEF